MQTKLRSLSDEVETGGQVWKRSRLEKQLWHAPVKTVSEQSYPYLIISVKLLVINYYIR